MAPADRRWTLAEIQAVVCVSHVSKENSVLRSGVRPELVYVIPNAVDAEQFAPREASHSGERPDSCHGHESDGQADVSSSGEVASSAIDDAGGTGTDVSSADPYLTVVVMNQPPGWRQRVHRRRRFAREEREEEAMREFIIECEGENGETMNTEQRTENKEIKK